MSKKLHRFLIEKIPDTERWVLTNEHVIHQMMHVLKFHAGEECIVFADGTSETRVRIESIDKSSIIVETQSTLDVVQPKRRLIAAVALVKKDTFETIVEKLTELGVAEIVPLITARTIKQSIRLDRLQTISDEALEQSGGTRRVLIHEPVTLSTCLEKYPIQTIVFDLGAPTLRNDFLGADLCMYIGPEGGWSDEDKAIFAKHSVTEVGLTTTTLRAETASIVGAYELLK